MRVTFDSTHEYCETPATPGYETIKANALAYVEAMKVGNEPGVYRKEEGGDPSFYGSYHGSHVLDLFGALPTDNAVLDAWADRIREHQARDGSFTHGARSGLTLSEMEPEWHYTRGHIWALRVLGRKPRHPFRFAEPLFEKGALSRYVKHYDWSNSWAAGNQVLAVFAVLMAMRDWFGVSEVDGLLERELYPTLEELIDPQTGYWGTQLGADPANALFGTIHVTPIYFAQGWPLRHLERNVDSTIALQRPDGSYWPGGSDCPDFDGAYMLLNLWRMTEYRSEDMEAAARRYLDHAMMHRDPDGLGFLLHRTDSRPQEWVPRPHWIWKPGQTDQPSAELRDDDPQRRAIMLGSWFYPLSIALVSMMLGDTGYEGPYRLCRASLHQMNVDGRLAIRGVEQTVRA